MNNNQLITIVNKSGLEKTKAEYILEKFQDYFKIASEWETRAKGIVVTSDDQTVDMEMARVGRLFLREKRITIEKTRKELKEQSLREGKAIDGIANVLKALIEPIEKYLDNQENFTKNRLIAEENERLRLERERLEKEEFEREQARIKAEIEKQERIKAENERLKREAIEREKLAEAERKKQEKLLADERAKAEIEKAHLEEMAKKEKEKADKKLKEEQAAKAKIEAEMIAKIEAEKREKREAEEKRLAEIKAKEEAEQKARQAPDKEKLIVYLNNINEIKKPEIVDQEMFKIFNIFINQLNEAVEKIKTEISHR